MQISKNASGLTLLRIASVGVLAAAMQPAAMAADATAAQIDALQKRVAELEAANDKQTDQIAQVKANVPSWVPNFTFTGDFRYRNETIDQEFVRKDRNRDRLRLRVGFVAKVNDTAKVTMQLSSSEPGGATSDGGDPRSP